MKRSEGDIFSNAILVLNGGIFSHITMIFAAVLPLLFMELAMGQHPNQGLDEPMQKNSNGKLVCYYASWSVYRADDRFNLDNIDPNLCTHLIYSFAGLKSNGTVISLDPWNDLTDNYGRGGYEKFNALRKVNPRLKTMIAIGGRNEGSGKFSTVVNDPSLRTNFVNSIVSFVGKYNFNGIDLDWQYPAQNGGSPSDKEAFIFLIRELRKEFDKYGYILSAAIQADAESIMTSYDLPALGKYLDFINVKTYDYHGCPAWWEVPAESVTGHNSPLYSRDSETGDAAHLNVDSSIKFLVQNGAPRDKLIVGFTAYGVSWTLASNSTTGIGAPATCNGFLEYYQISRMTENGGWTMEWDDKQNALYAYKDDQWISFDNPHSVAAKAKYAKRERLGGVMMWSIDTDDFHGGKFPLLNAVKSNSF